jgi:hypothetical protein
MTKEFSPSLVRPWAALMIILASGYWWIFMAGFQVRYYFPFILMVIIWLVADLVQYLSALSERWRILFAAPPLHVVGSCRTSVADSQMLRLEECLGSTVIGWIS